jgi:integrase
MKHLIQTTNPSKRIVWTSENIGYRVLSNRKRSYCFRYRDSVGVQRCKFLGPGSTQTQAKAKLAEVSVAKKRGDWVKVSREPFGSFAERWLNEQTGLEQSTLDVYRWHLETWITPSRHLREAISDVTHNDVADFIAELKRYRRPDGTALKGWTIRGAVSVLSGVFVEAVDQGVLASNPVEKVSKRKREKVDDETPKRILSIDEIDTLLAAARDRGLRWQALVGLFVFSGLRVGEALGLTWADVDLDAGELRVRKQRDAKTGVPVSAPRRVCADVVDDKALREHRVLRDTTTQGAADR